MFAADILTSNHRRYLIDGDCVDATSKMPDASIDAIVTDPPYLLGFMGSAFDEQDGIHNNPKMVQSNRHDPDQEGPRPRTNNSLYHGISDARYGLGTRTPEETVAAWQCADGCPVAELDRQSGILTSGSAIDGGHRRNDPSQNGIYGKGRGLFAEAGDAGHLYGDQGGASRFFPQSDWTTEEVSFVYCAKATRSEREAGLGHLPTRAYGQSNGAQAAITRGVNEYIQDGHFRVNKIKQVRSHHPTVKPIALMRWLVRLVAPANGKAIVLDPFLGSGTTGIAAALEGVAFIGIEREPEYMEIARARIAYWEKQPSGLVPSLPAMERPNPATASEDEF